MTTTAAIALAWQHQQAGNLRQAEALCRQVLDVEPQSVGALYLLGLVCQLQGRADECIAAYRRVVEINPRHADALHNLGAAYAGQGRFDEAAPCCRQAVQLRPEHAGSHANLGNVLTMQGRLDEAITSYQEALRLDPNSVQTANNLRAAQQARAAASPAPSGAEAIRNPSPNPLPATERGRNRLLAPPPRFGEGAGGGVPDSIPPSASAEALNRQGLDCMKQGQLTEAVACWQQALQIKEIPEVHNNLGCVYLAQANLDQAAASFRHALALEPRYYDAMRNLGVVHLRKKLFDEAVGYFQKAAALRPDFAEAHAQLGSVLLTAGKAKEARDAYREAVRLRPDHADMYRDLGLACAELEQWREAADCWRRSQALKPDDPQTYRHLGNALNRTGRAAGALGCFRKVLSLCPDDPEAQLMVEALGGSSPPAQVPADFLASSFDSLAGEFDQLLVGRLDYRGPQLLLAALGPPPEPRSLDILDLGCGTGLCGVAFRDWARTLIGVDLSSGMLARARERGVYDQLILNDLVSAALQSEGKYDLVLAADVLIYLGDLNPTAQAIYHALRPGGRFAFTVELLESGEYILQPTQRFAHSRSYLEGLARRSQMREVSVSEAVIRNEMGEGVRGLIVVWGR